MPPTFTTLHLPLAPLGSRGTFGGTLVAQSLLASLSTVGPRFSPTSIHCYFIRGGDPARHITYSVEHLRDGKNFSHREVRAFQGRDLVFASTVLFAQESPAQESVAHRKLRPLPSPGGYVPAGKLFAREVLASEERTAHAAGMPTARRLGGVAHLEAVRDAFETQRLAYRFPVGFFRHAGERRDLEGYFVRVRQPGESPAKVGAPSLSPTEIEGESPMALRVGAPSPVSRDSPAERHLVMPRSDPRWAYVELAYLSDSYLLLALPRLAGLPMYSHTFSVSLDHCIHFHHLPRVHDNVYVELSSARSHSDRHLVQAEYYDGKTGEIVASVSQEGLAAYGQRAKL